MWEALRKNFEVDNDDDMIGLINDFIMSHLEIQKEDPKEWIDRMEIMSSEMGALEVKYKKSNQEIIAQVFAHLGNLLRNDRCFPEQWQVQQS